MLRANMELDDNMEESAEDIAAAETVPRPMYETHLNKEILLFITKIWMDLKQSYRRRQVLKNERQYDFSILFSRDVHCSIGSKIPI